MIFRQIEDRFAILNQIPEALYATLVTHSHGELLIRVQAVLHWRQCMLAGRLPEQEELAWPEAFIKRTILMRLETLKIVQYCTNQEVLTDNILLDILEGISSAEDYFALKPGGFVDKLAQRQNIKHENSSFDDPESLADHVQQPVPSSPQAAPEHHAQPEEQYRSESDSTHSSASQYRQTAQSEITPSNPAKAQSEDVNSQMKGAQAESRVPRLADEEGHPEQTAEDVSMTLSAAPGEEGGHAQPSLDAASSEAIQITTDKLEQNWRELAEHWHALSAVYGELGGLLGQGWDLTQGVLAVQGWRDIARYRKLVKELPELKQLIALLGRWQKVLGDEHLAGVADTLYQPIKTHQKTIKDTWSQHAVMETGGIVLGQEINRLLPGELAQLGHPKLKMLWHARRAEGKLLNYCHCGLMPDIQLSEEQIAKDEITRKKPSTRISGPIIFCLDTSASMQGKPEKIAKALVLEGVRLAFEEKRPCHIYSFSGEQQLLEHDVDLTRAGLKQLLKFLKNSFSGGTDVVYPLHKALQKHQQEAWQDADILLLTDGRFPVRESEFNQLVKEKNKQGLRIHGVLLGVWKSKALHNLCDPLHVININESVVVD